MDNSNLDGCPYWIGNTCFKEVYKAIRSDTIDDCLSLMKSYDYNALVGY